MGDMPLIGKVAVGWLIILGLLMVAAILSGIATGFLGARTPPWYILRFSMWSLAIMLSISAGLAFMGMFATFLPGLFK